jgi:peroxiredoxin Q/BCP
MKAILQSLLISLFILGASTVSAQPIKVGATAPDFTLIDQNNKPQTLSKMRGQWVVMYFYPKDETPGCTTEACNFRDNILSLRVKKAAVWGISVDNSKSHAEFSEHHKLPFTLLADIGGKVAGQYGSLLNMVIFKVAKRHSFIIDPQGKIAKIYRNVNPKSHVEQILKDLEVLQKS